MRRKILIVVLIIAGVALYAYPHAASYMSVLRAADQAVSYNEAMEAMAEDERKAQWEAAVIYNENLAGNPVHDPFVEGSGMVMADNYYEVLSMEEDGIMGMVRIPKVKIQLPIYHGTAENTLRKGAGHLEGSSFPIGGAGTHSVVTAHTGLASAKMFTDLAEVKEGDVFFIEVLNETIAYEVDQITVVSPEDTQSLRKVKQEDYCTLVTCTPYGVNSHRLLVRGVRIPYTQDLEEQEEGFWLSWEQKLLLLITLVTTAVTLIFWKVLNKRLRRKVKQYWWEREGNG